MPVKGDPNSLHLGCTCHSVGDDLRSSLRAAQKEKFDFLAIPLAAPDGQGQGANFQPSVADLVLDGATWSSSVVGVVSDCLDPDNAAMATEPEARCACLLTEIRWAVHLGLRGILLPQPGQQRCMRYAGAVNELLLTGIVDGEDMALTLRCEASALGWSIWNRFRTLCDHHSRLHVALELTNKLAANERELERWMGEPVRFVIVPSTIFLKNNHGFPVLPKQLKALLMRLFRLNIKVILGLPPAEPCSEPPPAGSWLDADIAGPRISYIARLFQSLPTPTQAEKFAQSHLDCLQAPLQPLADNLESETYELFERDPVKYAQYEQAVRLFLEDKKKKGAQPPFVIMVVGAGRGPLVAASLRAASSADVAVSVWAVEKNANAVHTLRHRKRTEESWQCVEIVAEDMRTWQAPCKAHALVSELLGSFGDNELSPECLDGAQRFLAEDGVSIPQSYTSYLTPVSTTKLWEDVRGQGDRATIETGYVVQFHQAYFPSRSLKECYSFSHPNWSLVSNDRYAEVSFEVDTDTLVHGFAGYFDCELFGGVTISIHPERLSEGMFSWFPMFFPLRTPVYMRKGETITSHWWRKHAASKVWYEWGLSEPAASPVQNPGGRSWEIGL